MKQTVKKVRNHLKANNVRFFFDRKTRTIHTWKTGKHCQFRLEINQTMEDTGLICQSVFPVMTPESLRPVMASHLARLNSESSWGSFGMDTFDGEIRFRTTVPETWNSFTKHDLDYFIHVNAIILDSHFPELMETLGTRAVAPEGPDNSTSDSEPRVEWN